MSAMLASLSVAGLHLRNDALVLFTDLGGNCRAIAWLHSVNGIGEKPVEPDGKLPISVSDFIKKLNQNKGLRGYYGQACVFLNELPAASFTKLL
jgi:hypothetical protein